MDNSADSKAAFLSQKPAFSAKSRCFPLDLDVTLAWSWAEMGLFGTCW